MNWRFFIKYIKVIILAKAMRFKKRKFNRPQDGKMMKFISKKAGKFFRFGR